MSHYEDLGTLEDRAAQARADAAAHPDPQMESSGQSRMAYRLAVTSPGTLMHVADLGWYHWDGTRWAEDRGGKRTRQAVNTMLREAWRDAYDDKELMKDVQKSQSSSAKSGIITEAAALPEFAVDIEELDADPYLLNVANGTLDLRTMQLRPHDPADRCTKITAGAWREDTTGPRWDKFLAETIPHEETRAFLARYVGQALVGEVTEHKLAILTGTGGNGKGVWYGAVDFALGDYAITPQPDMLLARRSDSAFDGSVELRGARWAVFSEVDPGRALAPATLKRLTGGDRITGRQLYRNNISFTPSHTLAMVANHLPEVPDMSRGMWRRLLVVPFDQEVPESQMDEQLPGKLQAEADAVLSWAVRGLMDYQQRGRHLDPPQDVQAATAGYREESDQLSKFLEEATVERAGATVTTTALWSKYGDWAAQLGEAPQLTGRNKFAEALVDRMGWKKNSRGHWVGHELAQAGDGW